MSKKKNKETNYREALEELESIVGRVEQDDMDVDELSAQVQRAMELISFCRQRLTHTDELIRKAFEEGETEDAAD
jgi:exodeoxyribonuclease VII small subunit